MPSPIVVSVRHDHPCASTAPPTQKTPDFLSATAHAFKVAPLVATSSISSTCDGNDPTTETSTSNASSISRRRSCLSRIKANCAVCLRRTNRERTVSPLRSATAFASSSAWLNPLQKSRRQCNGTGHRVTAGRRASRQRPECGDISDDESPGARAATLRKSGRQRAHPTRDIAAPKAPPHRTSADVLAASPIRPPQRAYRTACP